MSNNLLPEGYEWLQYIESTGTEYIKIPYIANANTKYEVRTKLLGTSTAVIGSYNQWYGTHITIGQSKAVQIRVLSYASYTVSDVDTYDWHTVAITSTTSCKVDNTSYSFSLDDGKTPYTSTYLFKRNYGTDDAPEFDLNGKIQLAYAKIYEGSNCLYNLIPVKKLAQNENENDIIGLYDTVNQTFYTSSGGGSFTPGPSADKKANYVIKSLLLPSEYQEVEYVQSSGEQYIDTGIKPSLADFSFQTKMYANSGQLVNIGCRSKVASSVPPVANTFILQDGTIRADIVVQTASLTIWGNYFNQILNIDARVGKIVINGTSYIRTITSSSSVDYNFYLFGCNSEGTKEHLWAGKVYSFTMKQGNNIVRNFIPCKRKSDNKPGLYDLVTKQFFTNAATSGNDFTVGDNHNTTVQYMVKDLGSSLPSGYQELEYIQSDGNQYVNTGITAANARGWKVTYEPTELVTSYRAIIGAGYNSNNKRNWVDDDIATGNPRCSITWNTWNDIPNVTIAKRVVKVNYKNDRSIYYNDSLITSNVGSLNLESDNYNLYIFAINGNGSRADWNAVAKLYDLEITENSNIIAHYIPAKRTSDSAIGLYDTVNNVFKENSGTGTFTAGPIKSTIIDLTIKDNPLLPAEYQQREYIESNKEQWIDTGIPATDTVGWKIDYAALSYDGSNVIIGAGKVSEGKRCWLKDAASNPDGTYYGWNIEPQSHCIDTSKSTSKRTIKINYKNNRKVYLNDVQKADLDTLTDININLFLFACNSDSIFGKSKSRLYDLEITSGGAVIRHFIPCVRISDTKPGLYDTIRGQFYTNLGTGTDFTPGPIKIN